MINAWDNQTEPDVEEAISMMVAYWAETTDGEFAITRVLDSASNFYNTTAENADVYANVQQLH